MEVAYEKIISTCLVLGICTVAAIPVFANTGEKNEPTMPTLDGVENEALDPIMRYVPCSGGGKHEMYGRGGCTGYRGSASGSHTVLFEGGMTTQCRKCMQVLATEENPYWHPSRLGWYTMVTSWGDDIGTGYHHIYANDWTYNSDWASDEFFRSFSFYQ